MNLNRAVIYLYKNRMSRASSRDRYQPILTETSPHHLRLPPDATSLDTGRFSLGLSAAASSLIV
ncbi:hypothetical protein JB92DRAFT_2872774, partial [Gautieria morchelliformis]